MNGDNGVFNSGLTKGLGNIISFELKACEMHEIRLELQNLFNKMLHACLCS